MRIVNHERVDTIEIMKSIAERLKIARNRKKWTQAQLAAAAGVSTGTVGNIEAGIRQSPGSLPQLAEVLGVSHAWLAHGKGEMMALISSAKQENFSTLAADLARLFDALPEHQMLTRSRVYAAAAQIILQALDLLENAPLPPSRKTPAA